jgi:phospholipid N-methyltransferase
MNSNINYDWTNHSNYNFYNRYPHRELDEAIKISGLSACTDMVLIQSHIDSASHILEVGAGLGRITKYLCEHSKNSVIEAVEYSDELYKYLMSLHLPAIIHHANILQFYTKERFDLIVLPWACFAEFCPKEQMQLLHHLYSLCMPEATICIDLISSDRAPINACASAGKYHSIKSEIKDISLGLYFPTENDMSQMARECGFVHYHNINYITQTKCLRQMHIMHRR